MTAGLTCARPPEAGDGAARGWEPPPGCGTLGRVSDDDPYPVPTEASVLAGLPDGWRDRAPGAEDVPALADLLAAHQDRVRGSSSVDRAALRSEVVGEGSWTRRQLLVEDADGRVRAWATVHDRAAGRTIVAVTVDPALSDATGADTGADEGDAVAGALFGWAGGIAHEVARYRQRTGTQLDSGAYAGDERQRRWLAAAGYRQTRTWLQMSRPVRPEEGEEGALPPVREGVTVRRVGSHPDGSPVAQDIQTVHVLLEESFEDHFNSYKESFPEFVQRLREDPGHRWDHWWIATVEEAGRTHPAGAVVGSVLGPDADGREGSYIDYIGVHQRARGRGVAKALLHTVIADAARRGRSRVGLEVDADSPTGADGLYTSMGWRTRYRTESWHKDVVLGT